MDEDLRNHFKEARRTPFTRRIIKFVGQEYKMPTDIKLYDGTTDPENHLSRFAGAASSGEWPMPVWCRMLQQTLDRSARGWFERLPHDTINEWAELREAFAGRFSVRRAYFKEPYEIIKIIKKANESLTTFKERWMVETGFIMGVPKVMKISSFMDSVKSPELAKRFSDKVPTTVNEMMKRLDDFVRSKEAYASTELSKGETRESHRKISLPFNGKDTRPFRNACPIESRRDEFRNIYREDMHKKQKVRETMESWMNIPISFLAISSEDISKEPLIIEAEVERYLARRLYMDEGSSVEVMFEHYFKNLNLKINGRLKETQMDLVGFAREVLKPLGKIELEVCFGNRGLCRRTSMKFIVVRAPLPNNIILGRPCLKALRAIPSTIHSMMKFPTPKRVATLVTRTLVTIGGGLSKASKDQLKRFLKDNMRVFAWEPSNMTGVPRRIIEHTLNVNPSLDPVCQKWRTFSMEKSGVVTNEVAEWVKAGRNLKAYVDDMVIKKRDEKTLLADIAETFDNLKKINMKLNPKKCSFGVEEGKFIGYMVTSEGIRANPKKTKALPDLQSP
nr:reverse transcriptase domain-containing protein [Tanacetum cinerariifolium]